MIPWWVASGAQKERWRRLQGSSIARLNACQVLAASKSRWDFVLNERWLDWLGPSSPFCPNVTYSILLRDPKARVESMANFLAANGWRAQTGTDMANYVTWALTAGRHGTQVASSDTYRATKADLRLAMKVLEGVDYFFDITSSPCSSKLFHMLGIKEIGWRNKKRSSAKRPVGNLPKPTHDTILMRHAYALRDLDCQWITTLL